MSAERPAGERVPIGLVPAKFMDARAQGHGAVHDAASDNDIRARAQGFGNRKCTQIGICRLHGVTGREGCPREHICGLRVQRLHPVIACDNGDAQVQPGLCDQSAHSRTASDRVYAACIGNNFHA